MNGEMTIESTFHFTRSQHGRKHLAVPAESLDEVVTEGHVPRIARLMALAIRFDRLLADGKLKDFADIARLGHITRARATQIMNLLMLAPEIQEAILFLPRVESGRDPIKEWQVRPIAATPDWEKQRRMWQAANTRPAR